MIYDRFCVLKFVLVFYTIFFWIIVVSAHVDRFSVSRTLDFCDSAHLVGEGLFDTGQEAVVSFFHTWVGGQIQQLVLDQGYQGVEGFSIDHLSSGHL